MLRVRKVWPPFWTRRTAIGATYTEHFVSLNRGKCVTPGGESPRNSHVPLSANNRRGGFRQQAPRSTPENDHKNQPYSPERVERRTMRWKPERQQTTGEPSKLRGEADRSELGLYITPKPPSWH
jgi:hypothetical protein